MTEFSRDDTVVLRDGDPIAAAYNPREAKAIAGAMQFAHDAIQCIGHCRRVFGPMIAVLDEVNRDETIKEDTQRIIAQFSELMDRLRE